MLEPHLVGLESGAYSAPQKAAKKGLCEGTHVMTMDGHLPVEYLSPGDRVITRSGARRLRAIIATPLTDCPVVVPVGAFGPGRPVADLQLGPEQTVQLADWNNGRLWGSDLGAVQVQRLIDRESLDWGEHTGRVFTYQLVFDQAETVYAEGMEIPCPGQARPAALLS